MNTSAFPKPGTGCALWAQCAHKVPCITYHIFDVFGRVIIYKKIPVFMYALPNDGKIFQTKSYKITIISEKNAVAVSFSNTKSGAIRWDLHRKKPPRSYLSEVAGIYLTGIWGW
jgi:hypothetical protein